MPACTLFNWILYAFGTHGLDLTCRLPNGLLQKAEQFLVRRDGRLAGESNLVAGVNAACYEGAWLAVPDFALFQPIIKVPTTNLSLTLGPQQRLLGFASAGFLGLRWMESTPSPGLGRRQRSFLDAPEIPLTVIGRGDVPQAIVTFARAVDGFGVA